MDNPVVIDGEEILYAIKDSENSILSNLRIHEAWEEGLFVDVKDLLRQHEERLSQIESDYKEILEQKNKKGIIDTIRMLFPMFFIISVTSNAWTLISLIL